MYAKSNIKVTTPRTKSVWTGIFVTSWIVGVTFLIGSVLLFRGGSALEGKVHNGHYFVTKGTYSFEVSHSMFMLSYFHHLVWIVLTVMSAVMYVFVAMQTQDLKWIESKKSN